MPQIPHLLLNTTKHAYIWAGDDAGTLPRLAEDHFSPISAATFLLAGPWQQDRIMLLGATHTRSDIPPDAAEVMSTRPRPPPTGRSRPRGHDLAGARSPPAGPRRPGHGRVRDAGTTHDRQLRPRRALGSGGVGGWSEGGADCWWCDVWGAWWGADGVDGVVGGVVAWLGGTWGLPDEQWVGGVLGGLSDRRGSGVVSGCAASVGECHWSGA